MDLASKARAISARCAALDWSRPRHDPTRVAAAYGRWLATLGLERRVRWVADPANVTAWQMRGIGVAQVWASIAAASGQRFSTISPLLNTAPETLALGRRPPTSAVFDTAAAWAFAITSHMTVAAGAWTASVEGWREVAERNPVMAQASILLCPGFPWAAPPMIACAASDAATAYANPRVWAAVVNMLTPPKDAALPLQPFIAKPPTLEEMVEAAVALSEPMIEACEAGAFAHTLLDDEIVVLAAPSIATDGRRLHCADGPALAWPRTRLYAWKGVLVPEELILQPHIMTPEMIRAVPDQPLQHTMIDLYAHTHGHRRCLQEIGGVIMHEDHTGRLWLVSPARRWLEPQPGDLKIVEVTNGTAEADGSRKTYWLNVPPQMQTAQEAVAWTYGLTPQDYEGLVVRT